MNLKKILENIDEYECIVLSDGENEAIIDKTDEFKTIDGVEHILLKNVGEPFPVPTEVFTRVMIINKEEFVLHEIAKIFCE